MITLDNVEIYLTDYADGELSPAQERELKAFLLLHPELEESLEDWKFAKLTPPVIRYPHKSQLKQMVSEGSIPGDAPRLIPDLTVRFENKAALYHKNTTVLFLRRLSAAAVLLLLICSANIYFYFQPPADFSVVDNIRIQKEEPLFPRQCMPSILHANVTCLPEKLALQRTLPDGKISGHRYARFSGNSFDGASQELEIIRRKRPVPEYYCLFYRRREKSRR